MSQFIPFKSISFEESRVFLYYDRHFYSNKQKIRKSIVIIMERVMQVLQEQHVAIAQNFSSISFLSCCLIIVESFILFFSSKVELKKKTIWVSHSSSARHWLLLLCGLAQTIETNWVLYIERLFGSRGLDFIYFQSRREMKLTSDILSTTTTEGEKCF